MNNKTIFFSSIVRAYTEDEVKIIGLGDDDEAPDNYIIISRYDDPGSPTAHRDEMVGLQTSTSAYEVSAAIASIDLCRNSIEITIREDKSEDVGAKTLIANFDIDENTFSNLKNYIDSIVLDSSIVLKTEF